MYRLAVCALLAAGLTGCSNLPSSSEAPDATYNSPGGLSSTRSHDTGDNIEIHSVRSGDTLTKILKSLGAPVARFYELPASARASFASLHPGDKVAVGRSENGELTLIGKHDQEGKWRLARYARQGVVELHRGPLSLGRQTLRWTGRLTESGTIRFGQEEALSPTVVKRVKALLKPSGLPAGTEVRVVTEQPVLGNQRVGNPELLAAQSVDAAGEMTLAMRYARDTGELHYFDQDGNPLVDDWVKHPIAGTPRVTSGFDPHRLHPLKRRIRPHNGVDYAAVTGTPVLAASRGVVTHAGWRGSWGKLITIRHTDGSETRYAHLSGINPATRRGAQVDAGQVIGRVGSTGLSTGPHLHFERRVAGRSVNPISVDGTIRPATRLKPHERTDFLAARHRALNLIKGDRTGVTLALNAAGVP